MWLVFQLISTLYQHNQYLFQQFCAKCMCIYTLRIAKLTKYGQLDIILTCEMYFYPTLVITPAIMKNSEIWQFPLNIDKIGTMRWSILANIPVDFHQNRRAYFIMYHLDRINLIYPCSN